MRELTLAEIKGTARAQLVAGGPTNVSLRQIAREMGMTAPALYRYVPSLDSLVIELCTDLYTELRLACAEAGGRIPENDPLNRLLEMAREFRRWVLAHPAESALIFGPPLPGVDQFHEQCQDLQHAGAAFGQIFIEQMLKLHQAGRLPQAREKGLQSTLEPHGELPDDVVYLFLSGWARMYGLIMSEAFGHLDWCLVDAEPLFEAELKAFTESLVSKVSS